MNTDLGKDQMISALASDNDRLYRETAGLRARVAELEAELDEALRCIAPANDAPLAPYAY